MKIKCLIITIMLTIIVFPFIFYAWTVPPIINFQGKITGSSGNSLNGNYEMFFSLYTEETGSSPIWNESQTATIFDGIYNVKLGAINPFTTYVVNHDILYLEVMILNPATNSYETLSPRQQMTSTAFSIKAGVAEKASDADKLDGKYAAEFALADHNHSFFVTLGNTNRTDLTLFDRLTNAESGIYYLNNYDDGAGGMRNAEALQNAIDDAYENGGGVVMLGEGEITMPLSELIVNTVLLTALLTM